MDPILECFPLKRFSSWIFTIFIGLPTTLPLDIMGNPAAGGGLKFAPCSARKVRGVHIDSLRQTAAGHALPMHSNSRHVFWIRNY